MFLKENIIHKNTFNYLTFLEDVINFNEEYTEIKDKIIQLEYNKVLEESILLEANSLWQKVIGFFKYLWKKILEFKNFIVSLYRKAKDWILKKFKKGDRIEVTINEATKKAEEAVKQAEDILKTQEASKEDLNKIKESLKKMSDDLDDKEFEKAQVMTIEELDRYMMGEESKDKSNSDSLASSIKLATNEAEHLASSNDNEKIEISREKINLGNEALKTQNKIINEKIKAATSAISKNKQDLTMKQIQQIDHTKLSVEDKKRIAYLKGISGAFENSNLSSLSKEEHDEYKKGLGIHNDNKDYAGRSKFKDEYKKYTDQINAARDAVDEVYYNAYHTQNKPIANKPVTIDNDSGKVVDDIELEREKQRNIIENGKKERELATKKAKEENDRKMKDLEKEHELKMKKMEEESNREKEEKIKEIMNNTKMSDSSKEMMIKNIRRTM